MIRQIHPDFETLDHATVWGLSPAQLHDRFWASRGIQVVRHGEATQLAEGAELYLLCESRLLTLFRLGELVETLSWISPRLIMIRVHDASDHGYREHVVSDETGNFRSFRRDYGGTDTRLARVALTPDPLIAEMWQTAVDTRTGWRQLRRAVTRDRRLAFTVEGRAFDRTDPGEVMGYMRRIVRVWQQPRSTINRANQLRREVWADADAELDQSVSCIGPAWIGAGRSIQGQTSIVGPAILWDHPEARPQSDPIYWGEIQPTQPVFHDQRQKSTGPNFLVRFGKRSFDIVFATIALLCTLPIYPLVMLAILIEDGRPFFFAHERETLGGRRFPCIKFRSMRKDAEDIKERLAAENKADGPQFFIENDPRLTRVGRLIRKLNIDELPQFLNVLVGHMSVVGPRPSPFKENQFCPAWREGRLSVRPGVTGLWQIKRSREAGLDFQEWIRYDLEYVDQMSLRLDLWIIWQTAKMFAAAFLGMDKQK